MMRLYQKKEQPPQFLKSKNCNALSICYNTHVSVEGEIIPELWEESAQERFLRKCRTQ